MADTTFSSGTVITSDWLNDVNDTVYGLPDTSSTALGDALVGVKLNATGSVARTQHSKNTDIISVDDFGAVGDGTTNDTTAIQAALDYVGTTLGGGELYVPAGTYKITAALAIPGGVHLRGAGYNLTVLSQATVSERVLYIPNTSMSCTVSGVGLTYSVTAAADVAAVRWDGGNGFMRGFAITDCNVGIEVTATIWMASAFTIGRYQKIGLYVHDCTDVFIDNFVMIAESGTQGSLGGIRLLDEVEAFVATNGDIYSGKYSLTTDAASNTRRVRPQSNKFQNVYFDSAADHNVLLNNTVDCDFNNCWFSFAGNGAAAKANVYMTNCDSVRFIGGQCVTAGGHGFVIEATCKRTTIKGMRVAENGGQSANVYDGINIAANTTDFIIEGNTFNNEHLWQASYEQKYGVNILAGTSDRYIVTGNLVTGNGTGGVFDGGTGLNKTVGSNY